MSRLPRPLRVLGLMAVTLVASPAAMAQSDKLTFIAEMDDAQITVGAPVSPAKGTACAIMDPVANTLTIKVVLDNLVGAETFTHIHGFAPPGAGAPPQFTLSGGLYKSDVWNYPEAFESQIIDELAYVKLHSSVFPTGEIRGQLKRATGTHVFLADMDAPQIITGSTSTARGLFCASVNTQTNTLDYQMTMTETLLQGPETLSHIHGYAAPGAGAPPQHTLPGGFHKKGSWTYPETDEPSILANLAYAKVHTSINPTGEIRGQMDLMSTSLPKDKICFVADMDAAQIITGSTSPARGTACAVMDPVFNTLHVQVVMDQLVGNETVSHIHGFAPPGAGAPPQFTFANGITKDQTWVYPEAVEESLLNDLAYVKLHSDVFPTGELRGQLNRVVSNATLVAWMDDSQVITGPTSPALGLFCASLDTTTNTMTYQMTMTQSLLVGTETLSHIHGYALPGFGAPPQHNLPNGFHKSGTWVYPELDEASILGGLAYAKVHTDVFPTGEIRGQALLQSSCEPVFTSYCTAGTSASGCQATVSASGFPSATADSGFSVTAAGVEGTKDALFFFGFNGAQAISWGNGTSYQCVVPPVKRGALHTGVGTSGACDGAFAEDLNARWAAKPHQNPGAGSTVFAQLWYRDPSSTSNRMSSMSDGVMFEVCP